MALTGLVAANNLSDVVDRERAWDNLGANISANVPIPSPSLDLNFAANKSLVDNISGNNLIAFSRASTGTFVGSNGLIQAAASGVPRFDHDPATEESLGLLVEEARTNQITYSNSQGNSSGWYFDGNKGGLNGAAGKNYFVVTSNTTETLAPDGTFTATKLTAPATIIGPTATPGISELNYAIHLVSVISTTGNPLTCSFFVKDSSNFANGLNKIGIMSGGAFNPAKQYATFDLVNKQVSSANATITEFPNGWYRLTFVVTEGGVFAFNAWNGLTGSLYIWGAQCEAGSFPTSYIPTTTATVTRAADVAQIAGTNLSSFYNAGRGTIYAEQFRQAGIEGVVTGDTASNRLLDWQLSRIYRTSWAGVNYVWTGAPAVSNTSLNRAALAYGATAYGAVNGTSYALSPVIPIASFSATSLNFQGAFSRIVFWDDQLPSSAIAAITSVSSVLIGALPSSYSLNATTLGKDILALEGVRNVSTRDFVFIKGLSSSAQPRLTSAAASAAAAASLRDNALLRASPVSTGDYTISGFFLDAASLRINNVSVASIATTPFSGSTATTSLLIASFLAPTNFRFTQAMTSGTVLTGDRAIPIEGNDLILYAKAGQN
jgi:hypothetical protein